MMEDMEKKLKMELLEKLMAEMDNSVGKKLAPKEPMVEVQEMESKVMPMDEAKDLIKDKMMGEEEDLEESPMEEMEEDMEMPSEEAMMDEDDDEDYSSNMMRRIQELRKKKSME